MSVAWNVHPRWRLVVAGNRDEFHARAALPLASWDDNPAIIAGRDISSQGTWMGVSRNGRFGVVTNIRDAGGPDPNKASRGALVTDYLASGDLPADLDVFNPFNLLVADHAGLHFVSNRPSDIRLSLGNGIHGLSNAVKGERWPRKERLNRALQSWLDSEVGDLALLFGCLADAEIAHDDEHPIFIRNPVYGTRCSTILAVDHDQAGRIMERRFDNSGTCTGETELAFRWRA